MKVKALRLRGFLHILLFLFSCIILLPPAATPLPPLRLRYINIMWQYGFAYGINDDDEYPVYVNVQTGWVCIGDPEKKGNAVEFINNCISVIDDDQQFVALWLKPDKLPNL